MINLILADDHSLYLEGLMLLLKEDDNINILGKANNGMDAILMAKNYHNKANILLLNYTCPFECKRQKIIS